MSTTDKLTAINAYPLPHIEAILNKLRATKFISTLDLKQGYCQIPFLKQKSRQYTAFTVPGRGLFQWKVMPFGLHSAPATFQRALDNIIRPEMERTAIVYLDDIIILGDSFQNHLHKLKVVLDKLKQANLQINAEKCTFCRHELKYLGHVVSRYGIHTDLDKVAAIEQLTPPTTVKQVRQFIGMASWYRRFIQDFSEIARPLSQLTHKHQMCAEANSLEGG